ncbi:tripartite tricarboxylate transporter TctB family protein [Billgrantia tianxiuensis]|jgi:putative tricarboxylic transport membrane protein|uniref:Tripartite tricarboxylate transporter TctB family protein n=1 Tax=Billgrantia tianxiuensis TaxID=2497861 RepID=A0A6I6SKE2_9GAMM|nr:MULTISPECIES: tripartite tricarboxylate transporter TctB family protein [Halomonas]MCE8033076.1 tripartite tricarboxylate transporter TctB family protein [Halomonas sp. MCCC 1A11057]QHC48854.1 tripartite tricarboxylate transporter TctB family protein [Halomonas tianxiuensis]
MLTLTKDRALALAMLVLVGILLVETGNIRPPTSWQPYGSALFPRILLGVIAVLATLILIRSLLAGAPRRTTPRRTFGEWLALNRTVLALFALFGLYALLLPLIGYLAATLGFLVASLALLLGIDSWRKWAINLAVSFTLAPLVYAIFRFGLKVWLP